MAQIYAWADDEYFAKLTAGWERDQNLIKGQIN